MWYWNREVRILSLPWHSTVLVLHFQKFQKFTLILKSLWKLHFSTWSDLQCFFQRPWPFFLRSTLQQNDIFCSKIRHNSKPNGSGSYFPTKFFSHGKWEMWEMTKFPMGIPGEISKISKLSKLLDFRCEFMDSVILGNKERPSEHFKPNWGSVAASNIKPPSPKFSP